MSSQIMTIYDLENLYYTNAGNRFLQASDTSAPIMKADDPVSTSTTGVYNAVYGMQAWVQLNMEANSVGMLGKYPWNRSGWRVIKGRSTSLPYGGQSATTTSLPDSRKPSFAEVSTKPKLSAVVFENTEVHEYLATEGGDDNIAAMQDLRAYMAAEHKEDTNVMLNTDGGTLAGDNFESMDRAVGAYKEVNDNKESDQSTAYSTDDLDIYGIDRDSAASWADAYVNQTSSSGTMRALSDTHLNSLQQNTLANGANPQGQVIQTGYDTWSTINQLYDPQVRYNLIGASTIQPGVNGAQAAEEGSAVGLKVASLFNRPVIQSKDTLKETGGISRIYMLDLSNPEGFDLPRLSMKIAKPTQYFEAGINQGDPFSVDKFTNKGMYRTMGELICTFFGAQGKVRDLSS